MGKMFIRAGGLAKRKRKLMSPTARASQLGRSLNVQPRVPHWWAIEVKTANEVEVCPRCHAIYYCKRWHTWSNQATKLPLSQKIRDRLCKQCRTLEIKGARHAEFGYEGELILTGLKPGERKENILRMVRNTASRAQLRDPQDKISNIQDRGSKVRILTTENQLAVAIGKQIASAFKGGKLNINFSHEDLPVHVVWTDKPQ